MKKNTFQPTVTTLDHRMMPAVGLLAAPTAGVATVRAIDQGIAETDAIWIGTHNESGKDAITVGGRLGIANGGKVAATQNGSVNEAIFVVDGPIVTGWNPLDPLSHWKSKIISQKDLRIGDIMLTTGRSATSVIIGATTRSVYTHAALYIGNGRVVEAVGEGVREVSLEDYLKENGEAMIVRPQELSDSQQQKLVDFARSQVGKGYDKAGAIASARFDWTKNALINSDPNRNSYYCSNLVTSAYKSIGKELFHSLEQTPGDLADRAVSNWLRNVKMEVAGNLKGI